ncbi:uncharacterized protein LOC135480673 [Liolophura sinensis]|uniref:uncharacterized protein LOC135480673 n=1 Tax=Liolophura sinensis TaxID=3198878 RepID=UPI003159432A
MRSFSASITLFLVTCSLHPGPSFSQQMMPVPAALLQQLADYGSDRLTAEVKKVQNAYSEAVEAFKTVNTTCNSLLQGKTDKCYSCVETSCRQRGEKVCKPSEWEAILSKGVKFLTKDLTKVLTGTFLVNEMGKAVVNVGEEIKDFIKGPVKNIVGDIGKTIGKGVGDVGKTVVKGVVDVGKGIGHVGEEIGHGAEHVGKEIGHGLVHVGEEIGHGVEHLGKEIGNGLSHVGDEIGKGIHHLSHEFHHIFGRRRRGFGRRASEPGCDAIKDGDGCNYYFNTCADCTLNPDQDCPGFKAAYDNYKASYESQLWLAKVTEWTYKIISVNVDGNSFDQGSLAYKKVEVTVRILGKDLKFWTSQSVNPYNPPIAASAIVMQAINLFKAA